MSAAIGSMQPAISRLPAFTGRRAIALATYVALAMVAGAVGLAIVTRPLEAGEPRDLAGPLWVIAVGMISNTSCAILGCYLVLRRLSLLGDAISHAVLPGIVLAYLFSGSVAGLPILLGAMALGMVTSALTQGISSLGRVSEDTSLGVVFTSLFALGVVLIQWFARSVDLDADCVLYGQIEFSAVGLTPVLGVEIARPLVSLLPALTVTLILVVIFWKELKLVAFDAALAQAMGFRVAVVHYLLMGLVAAVSVAAFESVGSILVVAMLVVPAATAALVADRLGWMMAWSVAFGWTAAIFGYIFAARIGGVAGMMAVVAGAQFAAAVFFAPRHGLVSRWLRNKALSLRIAREDVLAKLYRRDEFATGSVSIPTASGRSQPSEATDLLTRLAKSQLRWRGLLTQDNELTVAGRAAARHLVRAHRLWESYLDTHFDLPRDHLHEPAERMEHYLDAELQEEIAAELADRAVDPHGKAIPPRG